MRELVARSVRQLARQPWFVLCVTATIALCVGANAATFAIIRSVLLAPLPYPSASELFAVGARASLEIDATSRAFSFSNGLIGRKVRPRRRIY